jgi:hypothetical protein
MSFLYCTDDGREATVIFNECKKVALLFSAFGCAGLHLQRQEPALIGESD